MINSLASISATSSASSAVAADRTKAAAQSSGSTFDQILGQVIDSGVATLQAGESAAIQGIAGSLPPFKVVDTIMTAQRALQAAVSIRDKAVSAYQEISRMAI